jgi:hypothetical protein
MARGKQAKIGDENIAANGYHYIRTASGWRLKHHLIAEEKYGRFVDTTKEMVVFDDRNRENFNPDNIIIKPKSVGSDAKKRARIEARIQELQAELNDLD